MAPAGMTVVERAVRRERRLVLVLVLLLVVPCWAWIAWMARDMYGAMTGPSAWMMTATWDAPHVALLFLMWTAMMIAMMLPSASPLLLLYGSVVRRSDPAHAAVRIYLVAAGYLGVWTIFSEAATVLQLSLASAFVLSPMLVVSRRSAALLLAAAALYQLTPLKRRCRDSCAAPAVFLARHFKPGLPAALKLGAWHGLYCVGCCWVLMLLLFAGGVMNLYVIASLAIFVAVEKTARIGAVATYTASAGLAGLAAWQLFAS
jgi:predicted metal-binding membrane protein